MADADQSGASQPGDLAGRVTMYDPREESAKPRRDVPLNVFLAAKDAAYGAISYLDMDWTAHRPVQGDASPKVIAYWVACAVLDALDAEAHANAPSRRDQPGAR